MIRVRDAEVQLASKDNIKWGLKYERGYFGVLNERQCWGKSPSKNLRKNLRGSKNLPPVHPEL